MTSGLIWLYEVSWDVFGDKLLARGGRFQRRLHSRVDLLLLLLRLLLVDGDHLPNQTEKRKENPSKSIRARRQQKHMGNILLR